jgi:geranylgeranyl diphosphate synthase type I
MGGQSPTVATDPIGTSPARLTQTVQVDQQQLQAVIVSELTRRRSDVVAIDPQLAAAADRLVEFVIEGGKRLRPEFLWCGWRAAGGGTGTDQVLRVGAALELIQACALLHDDIIDRSERRRGRPSTHRALTLWHSASNLAGDSAHFGVSAAVLLGDLALAWADDLFVAGAAGLNAVDRALPVWRAMRTEVLSGQLLDLLATASATVDPAEQAAVAMRVNRFKTAAYTVERPLHLGAVLAGGSPECVAALRCYGADIGVAFQLRDDLLGVFGDPAVTGKPAGDDLLEGKRTVLLADARAALTGDPTLLAELDAGIGAPDADVARLAAIIAGTGAPDQQEQQIAALVRSGLAALSNSGQDGTPVIAPAAQQEMTELAHAATARRS